MQDSEIFSTFTYRGGDQKRILSKYNSQNNKVSSANMRTPIKSTERSAATS